MSDSPILSRSINIAELPAAPVEIVAGAEARAALAAANDLVSVDSFSATLELSRAPGGAIVAAGRVVADIVQTCVVSLQPVPAHIDEVFSVRFVSGRAAAEGALGEVIVDASLPDPPEVLAGPTLDVGELAEEHFVLAIDPYPRAPGAVLPGEGEAKSDDASTSPFAVLAAFPRTTKDFERK